MFELLPEGIYFWFLRLVFLGFLGAYAPSVGSVVANPMPESSGGIDWDEWERKSQSAGGFPPFLKLGKNQPQGSYVGYLFPPVRQVTTRFGREILTVIFAIPTSNGPEIYSLAISSKRLLSELLPLLKRVDRERAIIKIKLEWEGLGFMRQYRVTELDSDNSEIHKVILTIQKNYPQIASILGIEGREVKSPIEADAAMILEEVKELLEFSTEIPLDKLEKKILERYNEDAWALAKKRLVLKKGKVVGVKE